MINHKLINNNVSVNILPPGYIKQTTYSEYENYYPQIILYVNYNNDKYYIPVFQFEINNQIIYIGKNKIDSIDKQRQFNPLFKGIQKEEIIGTNMSKTNILKQHDVIKKNMYEYFVVVNIDDSLSGDFFVFCDEKIKLNTINKIEKNIQIFLINWYYSDY